MIMDLHIYLKVQFVRSFIVESQSHVVKYWGFALVASPANHPKVSVFDGLEKRLSILHSAPLYRILMHDFNLKQSVFTLCT